MTPALARSRRSTPTATTTPYEFRFFLIFCWLHDRVDMNLKNSSVCLLTRLFELISPSKTFSAHRRTSDIYEFSFKILMMDSLAGEPHY
jgi:hypothetical protein